MSRALIIAIMGILAISGVALRTIANKQSSAKTSNAKSKNELNEARTVDEVVELKQEIKDNQINSTHPANKVMQKKNTSANAADPFTAGGMEWLTMEEAGSLENISDKKFLVDIYTDWCGWCKVMDKNTFSDPKLKKYLSDHFHIVKFNAEQKEEVQFRGKEYNWKEEGRRGINTLAEEMLGGRLSYPTLVFYDKDFNKLKVSPGYKKADQLLGELQALN